MPLSSTEKLNEVFSMALEDRSRGYMDLVSNSNVILSVMKDKKMMKPFSGPSIRVSLLYAESGTYVRYRDFGFLNPAPAEILGDAEFTPKQAAVSVVVSGGELLRNSGSNQLLDLFETKMEGAERELKDRFAEDVHSAGTATEQIGGLQVAVPTTVDSGTYGSISRATNAIWRTSSYDAHSYFSGITQVTSSTVREIYEQIVIERSRGADGPDLIVASVQHYKAFAAATTAIQRITTERGVAGPGFPSLKFYGPGRSIDVTLEGGIGSAMPANVTYFLDSKGIGLRYHPERNFRPFNGRQRPINQDGMVQHIGFMGELVLENPLHQAKLYDSNTGA